MLRSRHEMTALGLLVLALLGACSDGGEVPPYLAPNTFAGAHREEIEYDCSLAAQCTVDNMMELAPNAEERCVEMTATRLNSDPTTQLSYLVRVNRCAASNNACRYITCVQQGGQGFGEMQMEKVSHSCQAHVQCGQESGTLTGDPTAIYNDCLLQRILDLDKYTADSQKAYQDAYWPCSTFQSCQFTQCFPY